MNKINHLTSYNPGEINVIWDVWPEEFISTGCLQRFINLLKRENFDILIQEEHHRVQHFLKEWESQLNEWPSRSDAINLDQLFLLTPKLSGVLYFSHNTVLSEAFFQHCPKKIGHPTDRLIDETAAKLLPSAKELTFSFPRQYCFEGFYNSWGFVRIERQDSEGNGAGIALSVTTLDPEIMAMMRKYNFQYLAHLYNQSWNWAIHDYIHHIALYTNPSFGIGSISPISLLKIHEEIDQWGENMIDTFNYEYWAHCTHRLVTQAIIKQFSEKIISHAANYFRELARFQKVMLDDPNNSRDYVERIGIYLSCIYLWPLHILLHPEGSEMNQIGNFVDKIYLTVSEDRRTDADRLLHQSSYRGIEEIHSTPLMKGIQATLKSLDLINEPSKKKPFRKYEFIRLKTDLVVQRGMYEGWYHNHPIRFQTEEVHPIEAMHRFLNALKSTNHKRLNSSKDFKYELHGIVPAKAGSHAISS